MKGLLINEFYSLKSYILFYTALNIVYGFLFIPSQGTSTFIALAVGISISLVYRSVISEESTKFVQYVLVTKANRNKYVLSKFLILPMVTIGAALEAFLIILIYNLFNPTISFAFSDENLYTAVGTISYIIITGSVTLTLAFYFGYDKLIMFLTIILIVPVLIIEIYSSYFMTNDLNFIVMTTLNILPFIAVIVWFLCYRISVRVFNKKDL